MNRGITTGIKSNERRTGQEQEKELEKKNEIMGI